MPDTVEEMCPEMPRLDKLLKDVNDVSESGARYSDMPQVWMASRKLFLIESLHGHFYMLYRRYLSRIQYLYGGQLAPL